MQENITTEKSSNNAPPHEKAKLYLADPQILASDPGHFFGNILYFQLTAEEKLDWIWTLISGIQAKKDWLAMEDYCDNLKRQLYNHSLNFDDAFRGFAKERDAGDHTMEVQG